MPEGLEAEIWREALDVVVGRRVADVSVDERVADPGVHAAVGERIESVRRRGKVVLLDTSGPVLALRFGMTGRLVVDGVAPIETLAYASAADRPEWDRLRIRTEPAAASGAVAIRLNDPRRLGRVEVDPDLGRLGPDVLDVSRRELADALRRRSAPVKAALMNQEVVSGLGNLCADEVLFASGIAPSRRADRLDPSDVSALHRAIRRRLPAMLDAGGSTAGVLDPVRRRDLPPCPRRGCGGRLEARRIGGRTTVWCPEHQPPEPSGAAVDAPPVADC